MSRLRSDQDNKNVVEQGFTLVELLIVIVILGILAGIVMFAVGNLTDTAKKNACATEADTFGTAIQAYRANNNNNLPDGNGGTAGIGTPNQVAAVLYGQNLLQKNTVKYGVAGTATAGQAQWGFNTTTGVITPESTKCVGS